MLKLVVSTWFQKVNNQQLDRESSILMHYLDPKITARRKKYKKERRTNFIEGWVEFKDKKKAKSLAEYLNMREIGGKRTNEYYHEMWNIKYLPKFKWHHFTEHMGKSTAISCMLHLLIYVRSIRKTSPSTTT